MKTSLFIGSLLLSFHITAQTDFDRYFEPKSLRIDFALSGNREQQAAAIRGLREEPVWGGPRKNCIDTFNYGGHYIYVYDAATDKLIYSRGFNTLFEEWRSTEEAKSETQSWDNSISVPFPKQPIRIEIAARDKRDMQFHPLLSQTVDPQSIFINRGKLHQNKVHALQQKGDVTSKVDLVFLAEGYTANEQAKFVADARRFMEGCRRTPLHGSPLRRPAFFRQKRGFQRMGSRTGIGRFGHGCFRQRHL